MLPLATDAPMRFLAISVLIILLPILVVAALIVAWPIILIGAFIVALSMGSETFKRAPRIVPT